MNQDFIMAIDQIAKSKGINKEKLIDAIKQSIEVACKKHFGLSANGKQNLKIMIDETTGDVQVFASKTIVPDGEVDNELLEINLSEAKELNSIVEVDDVIDVEITPRNFGRIAAQNAKQVVIQKIKYCLFNHFDNTAFKIVLFFKLSACACFRTAITDTFTRLLPS